MKIAVVTYYQGNYELLFDKVKANRQEYCDKHGYDFIAVKKDTNAKCLEKYFIIRDILHNYDWVWWTDLDAIITNYSIKVEDRIDDNYSMVMSKDSNGLNDGSILVKNSSWSFGYIKWLEDNKDEVLTFLWQAQTMLTNNWEKWAEGIKIIPQDHLNSYFYQLYDLPVTLLGQWQPGDWFLHFPGLDLGQRLFLVDKFLHNVNK